MRVPGQRAGWLSRHWGVPVVAEQGEGFVSRSYKWDTLPWVMRLKVVQPKQRGLLPGSCPRADGSLCRLSLGTG